MGTAKEHLIEIETRGFNDISKYICADCVEDKFLKKWIIDNSTETETCDYCGEEKHVVLMTDLMDEVIMPTFRKYYDYAVAQLGRNSREGGYQWTIYDNDEVVVYDFGTYISNNDDVLSDIKNSIVDEPWCKKNPYGFTDRERNEYSWKCFSNLVKYSNRYFFVNQITDTYSDTLSPMNILFKIANEVKKLGLVKIIKTNTIFFRARLYKEKDKKIHDSKNLGSPPKELATNGRMNACGISCFYASDDKEISKKEILNEDLKQNEELVIAKFKNLRDLKILDLTAISRLDMPSIFDLENYDNRETILFLRALNNELIRPIENLQDIEYVPTQIFAEYFKLEEKLDGIKYNSSKDNNGICYVLFFNNEQCIDDELNDSWQDRCVLKLLDHKVYNT